MDLETTGLDPEQGCSIIEIGAVRIDNGTIDRTFQQLVDPGMNIPKKITEITGIKQEDVADAPTIDQILPKFQAFAGDSIYIAHNAPFDLKFLRHFGNETMGNQSIDTLRLARRLLDLESHSLTYLIQHLNLTRKEAHRALDDALATAEIFLILSEEIINPRDYYDCNLPDCILQETPWASEKPSLTKKRIADAKKARKYIKTLLLHSSEELGVNKWSRILAGSTSQSVAKYKDHAGFGSMEDFSQVEIRQILTNMVEEGELQQTQGHYPVLRPVPPESDFQPKPIMPTVDSPF